MADPVAILGAGLSGLSAAYQLKKKGVETVVFEKEDRPGGLARTVESKGFLFDFTGHFLHFKNPEIRKWITELMGAELMEVKRMAWVYSHGAYTRYPFQANLYGLPPAVIRECLQGLVANLATPRRDDRAMNFLAWNQATFGEGICKHFMVPYNEKLFGRKLDQLTCDWIDRFIPRPSLSDVIDGAFEDRVGKFGYNATFLYPRSGGIQRLPEAIARHAPGIVLNTRVVSIDPKRKLVKTEVGEMRYRRLISTLPLPVLLGLVRQVPAPARKAAAALRFRSVVNVNFGVKGTLRADAHWIYVPEPTFGFYRVSVPTNVCAKMAPEGHATIAVEFAAEPGDEDVDKRIQVAEKGLRTMGILNGNQTIVHTKVLRLQPAYVVFDQRRNEAVKALQRQLRTWRIVSTGRYGGWKYSSMEDAIEDGRAAAEAVTKG